MSAAVVAAVAVVVVMKNKFEKINLSNFKQLKEPQFAIFPCSPNLRYCFCLKLRYFLVIFAKQIDDQAKKKKYKPWSYKHS